MLVVLARITHSAVDLWTSHVCYTVPGIASLPLFELVSSIAGKDQDPLSKSMVSPSSASRVPR
jgi:hypothetical protein